MRFNRAGPFDSWLTVYSSGDAIPHVSVSFSEARPHKMESESTSKTNRILVLHWFPLEQYPPAMNLLQYFGGLPDCCVAVCSTNNDRGLPPYENASIALSRSPFPSRKSSQVKRLIAFLAFPLMAFWRLIQFRPDVVLSIEPHSSFPATLYGLMNRRHRLFIHYHEYYEPSHFNAPGMRLISIFHWFEKKFLYKRADWISQTNQQRVDLFLQDHPDVDDRKLKVLPNYPPASWSTELRTWPNEAKQPLKLIYVGALSLEDTFISELVHWIQSRPDVALTLDIFTNNVAASTISFLSQIIDHRITYHSIPVPYQQLPELLPNFHIGLILYKANTKNYIYNASNKLFEYLSCGLDVLYSKTMLGIRPYARNNVCPRVIEADFEDLTALDIDGLRARAGLLHDPWTGSCETELARLAAEMRACS